MTVLPDLERQLVRAAGGRRAGAPHDRPGRVRRGWGAMAFGVAVVAAVVLVFATLGTHRTPTGAPRPAAPTVDPTVPATYAQACARIGNCGAGLPSRPGSARAQTPIDSSAAANVSAVRSAASSGERVA
jgi:hypothetical protein